MAKKEYNKTPEKAAKGLILVPDTSVIVERLITEKIEKKEIVPKKIIINEAVLAELEHQANQGRETGYLGIDEIKKLRELAKKFNFTIEYKGKRPTEFEIRHAKSGEIDSLIRSLAQQENATLMTADRVQALIAQTKGIDTILIEFEKKLRPIVLEKFFDENTMSVHIRENIKAVAKKGRPGKWTFEEVTKEVLDRNAVHEIAKEIVEEAAKREDSFIETQRRHSTIVQMGRYRIVITRPPFSDGYEITAVRPVKILSMKDYNLSPKLLERIETKAEGILIAGAPGMGKTTFAQALAEYYEKKQKIVKTVEAPRDLQLPEAITQYSLSHGSPKEIRDILLLSRPDYTIYDEMRDTDDFKLFADLRLSGVGMVGVVHGTAPIDAIQRFLGRIELGVIPHVVDTVIFIKNGEVNKVFNISMEVKVPAGMVEADLARPVVVVRDFETGKLEFEIYSYGEETVVIPVKAAAFSPLQSLAAQTIEREFRKYVDNVSVDFASDNRAIVYIPPHAVAAIIGKQGKNIEMLEQRLGISIDIQELKKKRKKDRAEHSF